MAVKSRLVKVTIIAFWAVMAGWLIRYEAFPHYFAHTMAGYRGFFADGPMLMDSWTKITFEDAHIGYSHTRMDVNESDPSEQYLLQNETVLEMNIMGEMQHVNVTADASLDVLYRLQHFRFVMSSQRYVLRIDGRRVQGETFRIRMDSPAGRQSLQMEISDDVVFHSPMTEMMLLKMKPGEEISMKTLDPSTLSISDLTIRALRREPFTTGDGEVDAMVLATDYQGMEILSWLGPDGIVLRQETPFGWVMEACSSVDAIAYGEDITRSRDILRAMAMPAHGTIQDPRACRQLELRLRGLRLEPESIETDRQHVKRVDDEGVVIVVEQQEFPGALDGVQEQAEKYLSPSPFIQSDHDAIIKKARRIVGRKTGIDAALAIHDWVYERVDKDPTVSLPSAIDVLETMKGDCNEHTYLFVALARAAGLPAKVRIGVVYLGDAFYYHAWPSVYVGEWLDMDPTLGQESADATHIFLTEGEFSTQMRLLSVIGQVEADIVADRYQRTAPTGIGPGLRPMD